MTKQASNWPSFNSKESKRKRKKNKWERKQKLEWRQLRRRMLIGWKIQRKVDLIDLKFRGISWLMPNLQLIRLEVGRLTLKNSNRQMQIWFFSHLRDLFQRRQRYNPSLQRSNRWKRQSMIQWRLLRMNPVSRPPNKCLIKANQYWTNPKKILS